MGTSPRQTKTEKKAPDFAMLFSILVLLIFGLLMVFSASSLGGGALGAEENIFWYFTRQLRWAALGVVLFFSAVFVDLRWLRRATPLFAGLVLVALCAVLLTEAGREIYGASRWLVLGPLRFQPSELAKLAVVFLLAALFSRWREDTRRLYPHFLTAVLLIGGYSGLILMGPDLGTTFIVAATGFSLLFVAGARIWHLLVLAAAGTAAGAYSILASPYQMQRLATFRDPWMDPLDGGYQILQGLYAIGSGGLTGLGLGNSRQVYWVPQQHTDFIFAILAEETGFLGAGLVVAMFVLFVFRGMVISRDAPSRYLRYLAFGLTFMIAAQALVNIAVVTSLLPTTGITLPFISYGGSSLVITLSASGLILNVSRYRKEGTAGG